LIVIRCGAAMTAVALIVSWALSRSHRHGVVVDGWRRYAISSVGSAIELRFATRTNADFSTNPPSLKNVPFASPGRRFDIAWSAPTGWVNATSGKKIWVWPVLVVKPSLLPQSAEFFSGGEFPVFEPSAAGAATVHYVKFGERTRVTYVPYWIPLATAALLFAPSLGLRRRRPTAGHCQRCGYDLRASPDRCPEMFSPL
jgi:hypothetical protein